MPRQKSCPLAGCFEEEGHVVSEVYRIRGDLMI